MENKDELAAASFTGLVLHGICLGLSNIPEEHCVITIMEMQLPHCGQSLGSELEKLHMFYLLCFHPCSDFALPQHSI